MISAIWTLLNVGSLQFATFLRVLVPIMVVETTLDLALINWIPDLLERRKND